MKNEIQEKLQALFVEYTESLPHKMQKLNELRDALFAKREHMVLEDFHREVHSLCGSAAIYGYNGLSKSARTLETYLKNLLENNGPLEKPQQLEIDNLLAKIKMSILEEPEPKMRAPQPHRAPEVSVTDASAVGLKRRNKILLYDSDQEFVQQLTQGFGQDYELITLRDLNELSELLNTDITTTCAVIINVDILTKADCWELKEMGKKMPKTFPIIMVSQQADMETRLRGLRCGSTAFLQKPIETFQFTKMLDEVTVEATEEDCYRILIIDDSEPLARYYATILEEAGMEVMVVTNPMETLNILSEFKPDLLLLDI